MQLDNTLIFKVVWHAQIILDHTLKKSLKNIPLDRLESFGVSFVGMVKTDLKLIDLSLQSLLNAESLTLGLLLGLQGGRHGLHGTGVVLPV